MLLAGEARHHPFMMEAHMIDITGPSAATELPSPRVLTTHLRFRQLPREAKVRFGGITNYIVHIVRLIFMQSFTSHNYLYNVCIMQSK